MYRVVAFLAVLVTLLAATAAEAANPIVAAAERTATMRSSTFRMSAATTVDRGTKIRIVGTGATDGNDAKLHLRTATGGKAEVVDAVLLREGHAVVVYLRSSTLQARLPAGKSWLRIDLSKQAGGLGVNFSSLVDTAQTLAPLEKGLVGTTRVGREDVAGATTTHYRAVIDVHRAARAVPAYGKQVAAVERAAGVRLRNSPYDVWVGADGRIRQLRYVTPVVADGARGNTLQTITFLSFDRSVPIAAPPKSQVFSP